MADDVLIQPLDLSDFAFPPEDVNPGFGDLINSEVGDTGGPTDGFDDVVAELEGFVDALDSGLSLLGGQEGGDLDETFAEILTLDPEGPRQNIVDHHAAAADFDSGVDDLGNLLTGAGPPQPPQPTPPGGGGAPAVTIINFGQFFPDGTQQQLTIEYDNGSGAAVTIKGITFTPVATSLPGATWQFPALVFPIVVPPGGKTTFTVGLTSPANVEGDDFADMVVDADATPPRGHYRLVVAYSLSGPPPPPHPGGGGGTGRKL